MILGFPTDMWPCLLHTVDIVCNGTGDTSTLRAFMGKPSFPSIFDKHRTSLFTNTFDTALKYAKEGVFNTRKCTPNTLTGIAHPSKYHTAKEDFLIKHKPQFMAAINAHYTDKWNVTLLQATKILCTLYHSACDHEEPDGSLSHWLMLYIPTLHWDVHAPHLVPLL